MNFKRTWDTVKLIKFKENKFMNKGWNLDCFDYEIDKQLIS